MFKKLLIIVVTMTAAFPTLAKSQVFNASLIPDVAIFNKSTRIEGFILNIWGENPQSAFALGLVNGSTGDSLGVSLALLGNYTEKYTGAQIAFVNYASKSMTGLQWGTVNYAKKMKGVQIGLVNYAENMDQGLQIGIVNVIRETKTWFEEFPNAVAPLFILANWRFE